MIKAVVQQGMVQLLEPIPKTWAEGSELGIARTEDKEVLSEDDGDDEPAYIENPTPEQLDEWKKEMNALCAKNTEENHQIMMRAIAEHKAFEKELMRKAMGLA